MENILQTASAICNISNIAEYHNGETYSNEMGVEYLNQTPDVSATSIPSPGLVDMSDYFEDISVDKTDTPIKTKASDSFSDSGIFDSSLSTSLDSKYQDLNTTNLQQEKSSIEFSSNLDSCLHSSTSNIENLSNVNTDVVHNESSQNSNNLSQEIKHTRPELSFVEMIAQCMLSSPKDKVALSDIYDHILKQYPYFETAPPAWRISVRHHLSTCDGFVKVGRVPLSRGFWWAVHPLCVDDFKNGIIERSMIRKRIGNLQPSKRVRKLKNTHKSQNKLMVDQSKPSNCSTDSTVTEQQMKNGMYPSICPKATSQLKNHNEVKDLLNVNEHDMYDSLAYQRLHGLATEHQQTHLSSTPVRTSQQSHLHQYHNNSSYYQQLTHYPYYQYPVDYSMSPDTFNHELAAQQYKDYYTAYYNNVQSNYPYYHPSSYANNLEHNGAQYSAMRKDRSYSNTRYSPY